jgi:hypothetical protein
VQQESESADAKYPATQLFKYPNNFARMRNNGGKRGAALSFQSESQAMKFQIPAGMDVAGRTVP